jgi:hypothetical protein
MAAIFWSNKKILFCDSGSKFSTLRLGLLQQVQHAKLGIPVGVQVQACCEFVVVVRSALFISKFNIRPNLSARQIQA